MKRYYLKVAVRLMDMTDEDVREERIVNHHVTADCETSARRSALERAWDSGLLVSRFTQVRVKETK